jgi:hypothetical protein
LCNWKDGSPPDPDRFARSGGEPQAFDLFPQRKLAGFNAGLSILMARQFGYSVTFSSCHSSTIPCTTLCSSVLLVGYIRFFLYLLISSGLISQLLEFQD